MDVYTFDKSLQERLVEFQTILCIDKHPLPGNKVKQCWSNYLELVLESSEWNALWKICRKQCITYGIPFPTVVYVEVQEINCSELAAVIKVSAVQSDIHLPQYHEVPLIQLYPTKQQEKKGLKIVETAESLDQVRFFYNHLWHPWDDLSTDNVTDWPSSHLQLRIDLFGVMQLPQCYEAMEYVRALLQEAKDIRNNFVTGENAVNEDNIVLTSNAYSLVKWHLRLKQIKKEIQLFENPSTRNFILQKHRIDGTSGIVSDDETCMWIIYDKVSLGDLAKFLPEVKRIYPVHTKVKCCSAVEKALVNAFKNDTILLLPGYYKLRALDVHRTCTIRGLRETNLPRVAAAEDSSFVMDFSSDAILENIFINCDAVTAAIIVRKGVLHIRNCNFQQLHQDSNCLGVLVLQGAHVKINNCSFSGMGVAVVASRGATVEITSSAMHSSQVGIQVSNKAILSAKDLNVLKSKDCAIKLVCDKCDKTENEFGSMALLESFISVKTSNLVVEDTFGSEVMVIHSRESMKYEEVDTKM